MTQREPLLPWLLRLWRHLWQNERAAWHAVPDDMAERLTHDERCLGPGLAAYFVKGALDRGLKIRTMTLPDTWLDHDAPQKQYDTAELNAQHIVEQAVAALGVSAALSHSKKA